MTGGAIKHIGADAAADRHAAGLRSAARWAALAGAACALAAAAALWASEGARVFVETAFSAMLACL